MYVSTCRLVHVRRYMQVGTCFCRYMCLMLLRETGGRNRLPMKRVISFECFVQKRLFVFERERERERERKIETRISNFCESFFSVETSKPDNAIRREEEKTFFSERIDKFTSRDRF